MLVVGDSRPGNDRPSVRERTLIGVETVDLQVAAALRRINPHLLYADKRNVRGKVSVLIVGNMKRIGLAEALSSVDVNAGIPARLLRKELLCHEGGRLLREADRVKGNVKPCRRAALIFNINLRIIRVEEKRLRSGAHAVCLQLRDLHVLAVNSQPVKMNIAEALGRIDPDALRPADVDLAAEGPVLILIDRDRDLLAVSLSRVEIDLRGREVRLLAGILLQSFNTHDSRRDVRVEVADRRVVSLDPLLKMLLHAAEELHFRRCETDGLVDVPVRGKSALLSALRIIVKNSPLDKIDRNCKVKGPLVINDVPCIADCDDIGKDEIDIRVARCPAPLEKLCGAKDLPELRRLMEAAVDRLIHLRKEGHQKFTKLILALIEGSVRRLLERLSLKVFKIRIRISRMADIRDKFRRGVLLLQLLLPLSHPEDMALCRLRKRRLPHDASSVLLNNIGADRELSASLI